MILVVEATGLVGMSVCERLRADGEFVRALVRRTSMRVCEDSSRLVREKTRARLSEAAKNGESLDNGRELQASWDRSLIIRVPLLVVSLLAQCLVLLVASAALSRSLF
jgi:nucleoside-diphosphate-sugar epimerase